MAGIDEYRAALRANVRGLWSGAISPGQFEEVMRIAISARLNQAWDEGASECGIKPDEYTTEEFLALGAAIQEELTHVGGFGQAIQEGSRANGGKLGPLLNRVNLWTNRYLDIQNRARTMACKDEKLEWVYGDTKHCITCLKLHGKVKRASQWEASGIRPQAPPNEALECGGWNCKCTRIPTTKPLSKGPLPRFRMAIAA